MQVELGSPRQPGQLLSDFIQRQQQLAAAQQALQFTVDPTAPARAAPHPMSVPMASQALVPDIKDVEGTHNLHLPPPLELKLPPALLPPSLLPPSALAVPYFPLQSGLLQAQPEQAACVVELPEQLRPPPQHEPQSQGLNPIPPEGAQHSKQPMHGLAALGAEFGQTLQRLQQGLGGAEPG